MRTGSYAEFSRLVHGATRTERTPLEGTIEISRRCPSSCVHCYNNLPTSDAEARKRELSLDEHRRLADEIAAAGCLWLLYTGGEIFARGDFLAIYEHARRAGLLVTLFTNGVLVNERIADELARWRPFSVEMTLYGATQDTYEAVTRLPGSYGRAMRAIELFIARGIPLKLKAVALSVNRHEIGALRRLAEGFGLEFRFDAMINPRIDGSGGPLGVRLSPAEIVELDLREPARVAEWKRLSEEANRAPWREGEAPTLYDCGGGLHAFAIDPYGGLSLCGLSRADVYDLRSGSFLEGWNGFLRKVRSRPATRRTKCALCSLRSMCGMCPANGELENGDPESPVEFLCETAHLRAAAFGIPVRPHGACEYCGSGNARILRAAENLRSEAPMHVAAGPAGNPDARACRRTGV